VTKRNRAPALLATNGFGGTKEDQADLAPRASASTGT
jgi:hypothetical protein